MNFPQKSLLLQLGYTLVSAESVARIRHGVNLLVMEISFEHEQDDGTHITYTMDFRVDERFSLLYGGFDLTLIRGSVSCLEGSGDRVQKIELNAEILNLSERVAVIVFGD